MKPPLQEEDTKSNRQSTKLWWDCFLRGEMSTPTGKTFKVEHWSPALWRTGTRGELRSQSSGKISHRWGLAPRVYWVPIHKNTGGVAFPIISILTYSHTYLLTFECIAPPQDPLTFLFSFEFCFFWLMCIWIMSRCDLCVASNPMALMGFHVMGIAYCAWLAISAYSYIII